jgi:hypothetical protein
MSAHRGFVFYHFAHPLVTVLAYLNRVIQFLSLSQWNLGLEAS